MTRIPWRFGEENFLGIQMQRLHYIVVVLLNMQEVTVDFHTI